MNKTINIDVPKGFEIDTENSNLAEGKIVFKKKKVTPWRESNPQITGFYVSSFSNIQEQYNPALIFGIGNENVFATKKQAKSMLAMAQLSQIIANDKRFGGFITDIEWSDASMDKYCISRFNASISTGAFCNNYHFLAFHTRNQRDLFLKENEDLIKQYFMID